MLEDRVRCKSLLNKVVTAEEAVEKVKNGMSIATSGLKHLGYPAAFFKALGERAKKGEIGNLNLWSQCLLGYDVEGILAEYGAVTRRMGSHGDSILRNKINENIVQCNDIPTELLPRMIRSKILGDLNITVINATAITEKGDIIPSDAVFDSPSYVEPAQIVVVEINDSLPLDLEGIHDIYLPSLTEKSRGIPLYDLTDKIGDPYIFAGEDKIDFIVECNGTYPDRSITKPYQSIPKPLDERLEKIGSDVLFFLKQEIKHGRLPKSLTPIECGIGRTPNSVMKRLSEESFRDLEIFSPGVTDEMIALVEEDKIKIINASGLGLSSNTREKVFRNLAHYKKKIILRPIEVIDNAEILCRLGCIAINGALEIDLYGNINNTHISGTHLINGIGGSDLFASNSYISIFTLFSVSSDGNISTIVPMVPHVDVPEHHVDVVVTEQGLADLRGLSPIERAESLIHSCAHPDYKPFLKKYFEKAKREVGGHQPHILDEAFSFYQRLKNTGSMKEE